MHSVLTGELHMADTPTIDIVAADLPLHCPPPGAPKWSLHPRVFLDIVHTGEAVCPYCNTRYVLKGKAPKGH